MANFAGNPQINIAAFFGPRDGKTGDSNLAADDLGIITEIFTNLWGRHPELQEDSAEYEQFLAARDHFLDNGFHIVEALILAAREVFPTAYEYEQRP